DATVLTCLMESKAVPPPVVMIRWNAPCVLQSALQKDGGTHRQDSIKRPQMQGATLQNPKRPPGGPPGRCPGPRQGDRAPLHSPLRETRGAPRALTVRDD